MQCRRAVLRMSLRTEYRPARAVVPLFMRGYETSERAMRQVTFDAVQRDAVLRMVKKNACLLFTISGARETHILGRNTVHVSSRQPTPFPLQASRKARSAYLCRAVSRHSTYCFHSIKYWVCNVCTTGLSRWRYGPVTFAAQACNAKKIFAGRIADSAGLCSCNVRRAGHLADKFPENRVVSTAVTHSLNCIVYDQHYLATPLDRPRLVSRAARIIAPRISLTRLCLTAGGAR